MEILYTLSIFIILVIAGSFLNRYIPKVPAALFQVMLGFLITYLPISLHFEFETETFMILVIAPLLFTDAYKAFRSELWLYKRPIIYMAIGLVIATVFIVGPFINFIIPSIPLGAAFALAAILSPTDAVAVKSITANMKLPKGLMSILEGESLLNDAAGLVSFRIALAAIIIGTFSLKSASQEFLIAALGGMVLGLILGVLAVTIKYINRDFLNSEPNIPVLIQLMVPIIVYFIAEEFHFSGIVAVVFSAIMFNLERSLFQKDSLDNQSVVSINFNQNTVSYILNGFVFVFLGYLLPDIFRNMVKFPDLDVSTGLIYVVLITLALAIVRFTFVYIFYVSFQTHSFNTSSKVLEFLKTRQLNVGNYSRFEYSLIASLCGIHGTITIATALMIPLTLNGEDFPLRDPILFIGSGVVLLSMILGTVFLPLTIKSEKNEVLIEEASIRSKILHEVIKILTEKYSNLETTSEKMGYAIAIKKLQEQEIYFSSDEKKLVKEYRRICKVVEDENQKKMIAILEKYDNDRYLRQILLVRKWRLRKLLSYSIARQIFISLYLSVMEIGFRRLLVLLNLIQNNESDKEEDTMIDPRYIKKYEDLKDSFYKFRFELPNIIDEFTYFSMDIAETQRTEDNSLAVDFIKNAYDNFDYTLYNVPADSYIEETRIIETEAIQLQKEKLKKLKSDNKIDKHSADSIIRDLNYNEALLFTNEE
ncbi:cation:proton antiporter [Gemella cuniculi]|uniref:cation:proton antiporter n=1 Tax=Gemella cuniculi TaxID=150240 RepID=UPI0004821D0C|nr:sodium:proton antiporter [Gemella cuniculi]